MPILLYALIPLLYAALALRLWTCRAAAPDQEGGPRGPVLARALLAAALIGHGVLIHFATFPDGGGMVFGFAQATSAMLWLGVCLYWVESLFFNLDSLGLLVLPVAAFVAPLPLLFPGTELGAVNAGPMFEVHFLIANFAYGLLALAAFHAVLMIGAERRLHHLRGVGAGMPVTVQRWLDTLPPLMTMEKLLFRLIGAGFVFLSLTVFSGLMFSEELFGRALRFDHKTVFALLSWVLFGGLLAGRLTWGWRGRAALRWVLIAFAALLLAYVGSRFVIEVLLHRS